MLLFCLMASGSVQAAGKKGLVKEGKKYYYYQKGSKVKNTWKKVKDKGVAYKYYFGSDGAAYAGKKAKPAIKKIKGATYAFDEKGRMIKGVVFIEKKFDNDLFCYTGTFYVFGKKGKLNKTDTKKLTKLYKKVIAGNTIPASEFQTILTKYGETEPLYTYYTGQGCDPSWDEGYFQYAHVVFAMHKNLNDGLDYIDGFRKFMKPAAIVKAAAM